MKLGLQYADSVIKTHYILRMKIILRYTLTLIRTGIFVYNIYNNSHPDPFLNSSIFGERDFLIGFYNMFYKITFRTDF